MWFCGRCGAQLVDPQCRRCGARTNPPTSESVTENRPVNPLAASALGAVAGVGSGAQFGAFSSAPGVGAGAASLAAPGLGAASGGGGSAGLVAASGGPATAVPQMSLVTKIFVVVAAVAVVGGGGTLGWRALRPAAVPVAAVPSQQTPAQNVPSVGSEKPQTATTTEFVKVNPWLPGVQIVDKQIDRNDGGCDGADEEGAGTATGINLCDVQDIGFGLVCWTDKSDFNNVLCWRPGNREFLRIEKPPGFRGLPAAKKPVYREVELANGLRCARATDGAGFSEDGEELAWSCGEDHQYFLVSVDQAKSQWTAQLVSGSPIFAKNAETVKVTKAFYAG